MSVNVKMMPNSRTRYVIPGDADRGRRSCGVSTVAKIGTQSSQAAAHEVATQLVAGIQSDDRILDGVDRFAALGVPTLVTPFLPFGLGRKLVRRGEANVPSPDRMKQIYGRAAEILTRRGVAAPNFRGGVSSLSETMGRRLKRAAALTHARELERSAPVPAHVARRAGAAEAGVPG